MSLTMVDTLRALFTYIIALVVVLGGGAMLYASRGEPDANNLQVVVAGFIGSALTFVFGSEVQTRTARQSNVATAAGAASATNGHSTKPHTENGQ